MNWNGVNYFKSSEFDSPDAPGSGENMDRDFIMKLDHLRSLVKSPLVINSGFRTQEHHNKIYKDKPEVPDSAHLRGLAADISCTTSQLRFKILDYAFLLGFRRIEIAPKHIHLDTDKSLPQNVAIHLAEYK